MNFLSSGRFWTGAVVSLIGLFVLYMFWRWEIERVEVPPGSFLVKIHKWGKPLPEDHILAPDDSYQGVIRDILPPGRYFLNPVFWTYEVHKMIEVPTGQCLVLTRRYGRPIAPERLDESDFLAQEGERGIVEQVLTPGLHSVNPYAYDYARDNRGHPSFEKAVVIGPDQVGVRTRKVGKDPAPLLKEKGSNPYVITEEGYRGVQAKFVPPGVHYVNPFVESISPVGIRSHKVEFKDIQFPTKDGFILRPVVGVEYAVIKERAPEVLVRITDTGILYQKDETPEDLAKNEILQKVILPVIRGNARLEGSNFNAADFISAGDEKTGADNARERLRKALDNAVRARCKVEGIEIRAVTLAHLDPPRDLADLIEMRRNALAEQKRNKEQIEQYKSEQELKAAQALKQQAKEKVEADTRKVEAKTDAERRLAGEKLKLEAELENAKTRMEAGQQEAKGILAKGKPEAEVIEAQNRAEVAKLRKAVQGFGGAQSYAQYMILGKIAPALTEIFASDDSEFARLFSSLLTAPSAPGNSGPKPIPLPR